MIDAWFTSGITDATENGGDLSFTAYAYSLTHDFELFGTGLVDNGGTVPYDGTITRIELDYANNDPTTPDFVISDISVDANRLVNTSDVEWSLDFLEAVSTGNDTFNVNGSSIRNLSGDIYSLRFNEVLVGANDTFNCATSTFASVYGDTVVALSANSVTGGDDTFNGAFNFAIGDVGTVSGTQFFGGADTFTDLAGATLSNPHLWGDVIDLENTTAPSSGGMTSSLLIVWALS